MSAATTARSESDPRPHASPGLVLLVDDEPLLLSSLRRILEAEGHRIETAESAAEAARWLGEPELAVVLLDLHLGPTHGLELLDRLRAERPEVEVIVMTGDASIDSAVGCIRRGAFDYLEKPFGDVYRVKTTVAQALERRRLVQRNRELEEELRGRDAAPALIGNSAPMRALQRTIASLHHNESHVLVQGESGTGKELVARALQVNSPRAAEPFVPVDCGALPETIIESELFGHEKGAFTGALGNAGLFRMAHGGTLFLDEIGEIPPSVQAKLLRALQHKEVRPVGSTATVEVDLRVISATHRDLESMVETGAFRADLFYRLNVVRIAIPPLRERREDIPLLAHHFLRKHAGARSPVDGIETDALELLARADWPGNVRELENAIESALALARGPKLGVADLRLPQASRGAPAPSTEGLPLELAAYEKAALERALREHGGDARAAARRLGVGRSTFYRKLSEHGISLRGRRGGSGQPLR